MVRPPSKHEIAFMIWLAVFPTLLMINLVLSEWLTMLPTAVRTLVLATIAVPIVIYGLMPILHKLRRAILAHQYGSSQGRNLFPRSHPIALSASSTFSGGPHGH
jgi:antibiotic biosynthesis monooxygenase (ABM) superfamily enzyme